MNFWIILNSFLTLLQYSSKMQCIISSSLHQPQPPPFNALTVSISWLWLQLILLYQVRIIIVCQHLIIKHLNNFHVISMSDSFNIRRFSVLKGLIIPSIKQQLLLSNFLPLRQDLGTIQGRITGKEKLQNGGCLQEEFLGHTLSSYQKFQI